MLAKFRFVVKVKNMIWDKFASSVFL